MSGQNVALKRDRAPRFFNVSLYFLALVLESARALGTLWGSAHVEMNATWEEST